MSRIIKIKEILFGFGLLFLFSCNDINQSAQIESVDYYLNLHDSVEYTGRWVCVECHYNNFKTYQHTGMGLSFDTATRDKSASVIGKDSILYDPFKDLHYQPFWDGDTMRLREFRIENGKITHERIEKINYIVGSGQHTNSHIFLSGQYAYQAPFTFYTQDSLFDLPPGFESGENNRFNRKIGLECMSCHNGFPDMVLGSDNKYTYIQEGIDCERCHGPGEIHEVLMRKRLEVDTSKYIDYSIVRPGRLTLDQQTDLCTRCHLQGTMVLQPGKSFYDFKPGMRLAEVLDVFRPLHEGGKEDFIMASHSERMVQSKCYLESNRSFTCIDCHIPHVTKTETPVSRYNNFCLDCHPKNENYCTISNQAMVEAESNCVLCHMRESYTRDIPHVRIHDHKITKPPTEEELKSPKIFKGLISSNNLNPDNLTMARGYLLEYESFHPDPTYLDSAYYYLYKDEISNKDYLFNALINCHFLKNDFDSIMAMVSAKGIQFVLDSMLTEIEYSNYDAWTSYRIGQAYENTGNLLIAGYFYEKAILLAKYILDFQNKYGTYLVKSGKLNEAFKVYEFIISEDPRYVSAYVNYGYSLMIAGHLEMAKQNYLKALSLNPDHIQAMINLAGLNFTEDNFTEGTYLLNRVLKLEPANIQALAMKNRLDQK